MKIVVDLQGIQNDSRYRGIGRYSIALTKALIRNKQDNEIIVLLSDLFPESIEEARQSLGEEAANCTIKVWSGVGPTAYLNKKNHWRREVSELLREAYIANLDPDVVIISSMVEGGIDNAVISSSKISKVFTTAILYDLIPYIYKNEYLPHPTSLEWYEERLTELKKVQFLFAISESSRMEGIQYLGFEPDQIMNISAAIGEEFSVREYSLEEEKKLHEKFLITKPFLMYSGAFDPRKNIERLIAAYASLPEGIKKSHQLVLAGGINPAQREKLELYFRKFALDLADVVITGRISDAELSGLYSLCKAYVLPTYHEGFGLTALEAMACGAPTIGSSASSVPEVIGLKSALFDPFSVKDIAEKISLVLSSGSYREELIEHGKNQIKKFSWDHTASKLLKSLGEMDERGLLKAFKSQDLPNHRTQELLKRIAEISSFRSIEKIELKIVASLISQMTSRKDVRPILYLDISELHARDSKSGIQRVVRSVIHQLLQWTGGNYKIELVYATEFEPYRIANRFMQGLKDSPLNQSEQTDEILSPREGDVFLALDFQDRIVISHERFYEHLMGIGVKVFFVVYDLLPIHLASTFEKEVVENYSQWLRIVKDQDGAICISESVAKELDSWITEHYGFTNAFHIDWFHLGADIENSIPTRGIPLNAIDALALISAGQTFLTVGTMEPRKCHQQILDAFDELWKEGEAVNLVVVGRHGWLTEKLATRMTTHERYGSSLFWYEVASDEFLEKIYQASSCLIAASQAEGFGLPLIEAAQYGLPIIARDIPVFREVAQNGAMYFTGDDADSLAKVIQHWLALKRQNQIPDSRSIHWQNWEQSSKQLLSRIVPTFFKISFKFY
jgi:glycosyltransferase involved in cell wall biosynthesis